MPNINCITLLLCLHRYKPYEQMWNSFYCRGTYPSVG